MNRKNMVACPHGCQLGDINTIKIFNIINFVDLKTNFNRLHVPSANIFIKYLKLLEHTILEMCGHFITLHITISYEKF